MSTDANQSVAQQLTGVLGQIQAGLARQGFIAPANIVQPVPAVPPQAPVIEGAPSQF